MAITIIGTIFNPNICESADDGSKHLIIEPALQFMEGFNY